MRMHCISLHQCLKSFDTQITVGLVSILVSCQSKASCQCPQPSVTLILMYQCLLRLKIVLENGMLMVQVTQQTEHLECRKYEREDND